MVKDMFQMTRHERQGSIVVLVIMALLMAGSVVVRHCHHAPPELQQIGIQQFESEADSSLLIVPSKPSGVHKPKHEKKSRKRQSRKPKPTKQPRHIDPVPQF